MAGAIVMHHTNTNIVSEAQNYTLEHPSPINVGENVTSLVGGFHTAFNTVFGVICVGCAVGFILSLIFPEERRFEDDYWRYYNGPR